jgi:hypothetical protein
VKSLQESPLDFEGNNDHFRSVKRELIADDVSSKGKYILSIANRQPDFLHLISPDASSDACMYIGIKIDIRTSKKSS